MAHAFYTIGHGRRPIGEFVDLLREVEVTLLADVRTMPRSRANPQFNEDALPQALQPFGIAYAHMTDLGGLRGRQKSVAPEINGFWENESFHNYADYAMSERFRSALAHLRERGRKQRCAIMCAETVWWRCHRRIITDYLLAAGETVFHILGPGQVEAAAVNEVAQVQGAGTLVYPAEPASQRDLFGQ
jgi:uncharacterized protein (DUF488 family)